MLSVVSSLPTHTLVSNQPFINPAAWLTGPVVSPAVQETYVKGGESKTKKKSHKSSKSDRTKLDVGTHAAASSGPALDIPGPGDDMQEPVFQPIQISSSSATCSELKATGPDG